jgi:hypothetical protein
MTQNAELIEKLHFGCIAITMARMDKTIAGIAVDYLHTVLAEMKISSDQRAIVDRMAEKIAAEGFDATYGAYSDCE